MSKEKLKTMLMQNFGVKQKHYANVEMANTKLNCITGNV